MDDNPAASLVSQKGVHPAPAPAHIAALKERQNRAAVGRFEARKAVRQQADKLKDQGLFLELEDPAKIAERAARKEGRRRQVPISYRR